MSRLPYIYCLLLSLSFPPLSSSISRLLFLVFHISLSPHFSPSLSLLVSLQIALPFSFSLFLPLSLMLLLSPFLFLKPCFPLSLSFPSLSLSDALLLSFLTPSCPALSVSEPPPLSLLPLSLAKAIVSNLK